MEKRSKHIVALIALILFTCIEAFPQKALPEMDPMFTQYMSSIQTVNPAYAGMWDKVGIQVLHRRLFAGADGATESQAFSLYSPVKNENNGIGLSVTNEEIGYEKRLSITGDYAYQIRLSWKTKLRLGLKAGIINFDNLLNRYDLYPDGKPDTEFQNDVDINLMVSWGVGALAYNEDYYISFSIPQIINNGFAKNRNNYSSLAELRYAYLIGGYVYKLPYQIKFKPSFMLKGAFEAPLQLDLAANFLFFDKFWVGAMYRTNNTIGFVTSFNLFNHIRFGYATDFSLSSGISHYSFGSHEFRVSYEFDFYRRPYVKKQYF
ncbi:PorP/SprF family type IX secretion system membrane protein [Sunxiuqinia sp. A32]|uniref:PorP/SprF family type IX secretion system membrane protein n=1 Tax=Sunxiuqinia sp. A32 TaxID=3461496 RepID=UPI0040463C0B